MPDGPSAANFFRTRLSPTSLVWQEGLGLAHIRLFVFEVVVVAKF